MTSEPDATHLRVVPLHAALLSESRAVRGPRWSVLYASRGSLRVHMSYRLHDASKKLRNSGRTVYLILQFIGSQNYTGELAYKTILNTPSHTP